MNCKNNFPAKAKELYDTVTKEIDNDRDEKWPPCFISYCWSNSRKAIKKSSKSKSAALGKIDPRDLKDKIEEAGIKCWMDIEQVGQSGLYQDIAEGLKKAKVIISCISEEYVTSKNCIMEFRFAALTLRLPVILVIVGTGLGWIKSEIGMLGLDYPKFDMSSPEEDLGKIIELIKACVKSDQETKAKNKEAELFTRKSGFSELLELAERKFIKYISSLNNPSSLRGAHPRLLIVDFFKEEHKGPIKGYCFYFLCEYDEVRKSLINYF